VIQTESQAPKVISVQRKAYAFERSMGLSKTEACRRVGGNPDHGQATKWEANKDVQAWIAYYRQKDLSDELLREKRIRMEETLNAIFYGDGADFPGENPPIDWTHRLNAAGQIRDMLGLRAPRRTELTGKGGGPVQTVDVTKLSNEQLIQLESILAAAAPAGDAEAGESGDRAADSAAGEGSGDNAPQPGIELPANGR
jgi:phage terminase small subunit